VWDDPRHDYEDEAEELIVSRPAARPKRASRTKAPAISPEGLAEKLEALAAGWDAPLAGLAEIAQAGSWHDAAVALRNAVGLDAAVAGLLRRIEAWPAVWDAVGLEEYRAAVDGFHGPAANAFRAVLAVTGTDSMSKHAWLLKFGPVRDVFNLRLAQRAVVAALGRLMATHPALVAACHRRAFHPLGYAAGVAVHTARTRRAGGIEGRTPYRLPAGRPLDALAWACAHLMTPEAAWLLANLDSLPPARPVPEGEEDPLAVFACPADWHS